MKNVFCFTLKVLFVFLYLPSPLFLVVGHCCRGRLKINLNVYGVINCLNKNLITYCLISWEEKRDEIEILSVDGVSHKERFNGKSCRKCNLELFPDPFLVLVNNLKQPLHTRNFFENKIFWKRIIKKPLKSKLCFLTFKKLTLFLLESGTSDQSFFRLRNKIRKIPLMVMYYLTKFDEVI